MTYLSKNINLFIKAIFTTLLLTVVINLNASDLYKTNIDLNLRSGPNKTYNSILIIKNGETVEVIDKSNTTWFKIKYKGKTGYLFSEYLIPIIVEKPRVEERPKPIQEEDNSGSIAVIIIFIILGVVVSIIYLSNRKTKSSKQNTTVSNQQLNNTRISQSPKRTTINQSSTIDNKIIEKIVDDLSNSIKIEVTTPSYKNPSIDKSIIDITDETYIISNHPSGLKKYENGVPFWTRYIVNSYSEIKTVSPEQRQFYINFKNGFLTGVFYDLEGNTNYAFILLFDLIEYYKLHSNFTVFEKHLNLLGQNYPITRTNCVYFINKYKKNDNYSKSIADKIIVRDTNEQNDYFYGNENNYDYWKLGSKYKAKLKLNDEEVKLLNKLWFPSNNFCSIEFCCIQIIKLYLASISGLNKKFIEQGTSLDFQLTQIADVIARKQHNYHTGSNNYKYSIESTFNEFYSNIFKHCENTVRENYGHKRKINAESNYTNAEAKAVYDNFITNHLKAVLFELSTTINLPDESTDIELYTQNTNRWKIKFEEITNNFSNSPSQFITDIIQLGNLNKNNPSVENIFFEASKFISKHDKESALILYVHYLHHDLKSVTFDNKQLTKTIQKNLFKTNEQLHDFEILVSEFIKDKNLEKALQSVTKIYAVKRKKIQLDSASIKEVQQQHSGTVELLNEYLKDEYEDENNSIKTQEISNEEVRIEITNKKEIAPNSIYIDGITFTQIHNSALDIFVKNNFTVPQNELESFAKSKGIFKNSLIESINDICYEILDDVLIEEEDEYYIINQNYYNKIIAQ